MKTVAADKKQIIAEHREQKMLKHSCNTEYIKRNLHFNKMFILCLSERKLTQKLQQNSCFVLEHFFK